MSVKRAFEEETNAEGGCKRTKEETFYLRFEVGVGSDWQNLLTIIIAPDGTLWYKGGRNGPKTRVVAQCSSEFLQRVKDIVSTSGILDLQASEWLPPLNGQKQEVGVQMDGKSFYCKTCRLGSPMRLLRDLSEHERCFHEFEQTLRCLLRDALGDWDGAEGTSDWDDDRFLPHWDATNRRWTTEERYVFEHVVEWKEDFVLPDDPFTDYLVVTIVHSSVVDDTTVNLELTTVAAETFQIPVAVSDTVHQVSYKIRRELSQQIGTQQLMLLGPDGEEVSNTSLWASR
eukprot:TRINITY_DN93356_c0_g1_i1.p1 TRINITY_DN93356_c0_g1~~TRINITY_DN93356_c0_g1_i1.p1  ORF type:complete len:305 (-),score=16.52 TRINITY_DN93356_c0_g1_i1:285-1142(-)